MATRKRGSKGKAPTAVGATHLSATSARPTDSKPKPRPVMPAEDTRAPAAVAPSFMARLPKATMGGGAQDVPGTASTSQVHSQVQSTFTLVNRLSTLLITLRRTIPPPPLSQKASRTYTSPVVRLVRKVLRRMWRTQRTS